MSKSQLKRIEAQKGKTTMVSLSDRLRADADRNTVSGDSGFSNEVMRDLQYTAKLEREAAAALETAVSPTLSVGRNAMTIDTTGLERAVEELTALKIVHFLQRAAETYREHEDFTAAIVSASLADLIRRGEYKEGVCDSSTTK